MGDAADGSLQDRYAAVERFYSQGQWPEVLEACAALLAELPDQPGDPLRTRLTLLQGHTLLYGFIQIDAAAAIYQQVLDSQPEPVLREIAAQELERCRQAMASEAQQAPAAETTPLSSAFPFTPEAVGQPATLQQVSAMPWLEALGEFDPAAATAPAPTQPSRIDPEPPQPPAERATVHENIEEINPTRDETDEIVVEVIDEPEQIVVHQADPQRSECLDLTPSGEAQEQPAETTPPAGRWSPAEEAELAKGLLRVVLR